MRKVLIILFVLPTQLAHAQFVERITEYLSPVKTITNPGFFSVNTGRSISSLAVKITTGQSFEGSFLVSSRDTFFLKEDDHTVMSEHLFSNLLIFPEPVYNFEFYYANIRDSVDMYLIDDKTDELVFESISHSSTGFKTGSFEMPEMIDQTEWRYGLNEPDYDRIVHEVHNVIVHHSASSNLLTDYTAAVRNIYLYHTAVRGWSDIGYNYIIAPNGDIYMGRDPGEYEQDLVMGAHFCSSNRGTMGVCMLGTFTEIAPTDTASASLEKLLVWKLGKDAMDPLGYYAHQLNPTLKVIAGHRDGCSTECPGEILYDRLSLLRDRVQNKITVLGVDLVGGSKNDHEIHLYPNPVDQILTITSSEPIDIISIYSIQGKLIKKIINPGTQIDFSDLENGQYLLSIHSVSGEFSRRIIKK